MSLPKEFYVVNDQLLVAPAKEDEYKESPSGIITKVSIYYPGERDQRRQPDIARGFVVLKGEGYPIWSEKDDLGGNDYRTTFIPLKVGIGDEVYFPKNVGGVLEITLEGNAYYLIRQNHVLVAKSQQD